MADVRLSIQKAIVNEGGYQKIANDRRNWSGGQIGSGMLVGTKYGITAQDMPGADIENLTVAAATQWYLTTKVPEQFTNPLYVEIVNQNICDKIFDLGVLFGVGEAVTCLQKALNTTPPPMLHVDGAFGPETLLLTNEAAPVKLLSDFKMEMATRAHEIVAAHPTDAEFLAGWLRRIAS